MGVEMDSKTGKKWLHCVASFPGLPLQYIILERKARLRNTITF